MCLSAGGINTLTRYRLYPWFFVAQAAQTQDIWRAVSGMLSSKLWLKVTWVHQHGACSTPVARCFSMAHWLGWPHSGHRAAEGAAGAAVRGMGAV